MEYQFQSCEMSISTLARVLWWNFFSILTKSKCHFLKSSFRNEKKIDLNQMFDIANIFIVQIHFTINSLSLMYVCVCVYVWFFYLLILFHNSINILSVFFFLFLRLMEGFDVLEYRLDCMYVYLHFSCFAFHLQSFS